jgi:CheY-like chemotaxis protein
MGTDPKQRGMPMPCASNPIQPLFVPETAQPPDDVKRLPLTGLTVLTVEDSRYASEALRLLCHRSGARLRRADTIATAMQHLRVYRPDIVIADLGLPDGCGTTLIANLARGGYDGLLLATSADPDGRSRALAAGAHGFLEKPVESLAAFQAMILSWYFGTKGPQNDVTGPVLSPDTQALRDDLRHAADMLSECDGPDRRYVTGFVRGLARGSHDKGLEQAADQACVSDRAFDGLAGELADRLKRAPQPFFRS